MFLTCILLESNKNIANPIGSYEIRETAETHTQSNISVHSVIIWGYVHMPLLPVFMLLALKSVALSYRLYPYRCTGTDWLHRRLLPRRPGPSVRFPIPADHLCPACRQDRSICSVPSCLSSATRNLKNILNVGKRRALSIDFVIINVWFFDVQNWETLTHVWFGVTVCDVVT